MADRIERPERGDLMVCWNRYTGIDEAAKQFEAAGARVLIAENGHLGKAWRGQNWLSLAIGHHAGAGQWHDGGAERWDGWKVALSPFRDGGHETVIFAQRSIGEHDVASPVMWAESAKRRFGGRIRNHPAGDAAPKVSLEVDLQDAVQAVTWHSAAALQALMLGVPVWYEFPKWIGSWASRHVCAWGQEPKRDEEARLTMFRRLAWSMWTPEEIASGLAIRTVLQ